MSFLIRKIEMSKWRQNDICNGEDISADAVTNSLKTKDNRLSWWRIENQEDITDAILAIVSSSEYLDTIDVIMLDEREITNSKLLIEQTLGNTPFSTFVNNHYDIIELTYKKLGQITEIIRDGFINNNDKRFSKGKIKKLLISGIESNKIEFSHLSEGLQRKLQKDIS